MVNEFIPVQSTSNRDVGVQAGAPGKDIHVRTGCSPSGPS